MRIAASVFGAFAGFAFIAASVAMNWIFMSGQGKTALEGQILGLVSVAVDVVKALLPFFIAAAWAQRRRLRATVGAGVFGLFFTFSLLSALGFVATNRGAVASGREAVAARFEFARQDLSDGEARLAALGATRPEGQIEADIAGLKQDRRWRSSQACAMATAQASRDFCAQMFALEGELARAKAAGGLRARIEGLRQEMKSSEDRGAGEDKDPQAGLLAHLSGLELSQAQQALSAFMAVLVEIGAASTLYLAVGDGAPAGRSKARARADSESEPEPELTGRPEGEERFRLPPSGRILLSG